jgi:hypothetical protein
MEGIEKSVNREAGLTVYTVQGTVSGEEIKNAVRDFYKHGPITRNVLWDLTQAVLTDLSAEDIRSISHVPRKSLELREGGKTAIIAPSDLAFGLGRMYQSSSPPEDLPFEIQVFRETEAAQQWLAENTFQGK